MAPLKYCVGSARPWECSACAGKVFPASAFTFNVLRFTHHVLRITFHASRITLFLAAASSLAADVDLSKLPPPSNTPVDFARDVHPILEHSCLRCHGPERPKSRFRLDNRESA